MNLRRMAGSAAALGALAVAAFLYTAHPARSSDHQDTFNLANRANASADITDVYVFPSPRDPNNVVLAMDVNPLIPTGMGPSKFFDPSVMWQFKIAHGPTGTMTPEDEVIQVGVSGTDANQLVTVYGPARPNEVGTSNTFVPAAGTIQYNVTRGTKLSNGIIAYAGPRADPFYFDLFQFFSFLGDRAYSTHTSESDPGFGNMLVDTKGKPNAAPSFNGFAAGTLSGPGGYACSTAASANALTDIGGGFNVLAFVIEVPRALLTAGYSSSVIHVWATAGSVSGA